MEGQLALLIPTIPAASPQLLGGPFPSNQHMASALHEPPSCPQTCPFSDFTGSSIPVHLKGLHFPLRVLVPWTPISHTRSCT